jgi:hypothetical protein
MTDGPIAQSAGLLPCGGFPYSPPPMRIAALPFTLPFALFLLLPAAVAAQATPPLTLEQVMADPDWIGPPVEQAWWSWDGKQVQYLLKRDGATIRDTYRQAIEGGTASRVDGTARAELDAANPAFDAQHTRMAFVRNGDVFVRDLRSGALTQVTRTDAA